MGYPNEIERWLLDLWMRFCPQSPRLDSRKINVFLMGTLFQSDQVWMTEEGFGGLWVYLKDLTLELHEGGDYDVAIPLGHLDQHELAGIPKAIRAYLEQDFSIE